MQQQPSEPLGGSFATRVQWAAFIAQILATSVQPFVRRRFGERYFGIEAALVLVAVPVYCVFWEERDLTPMLWFLGLYLVAVARAKAEIRARAKRGDHEHSFYGGHPLLCRVGPFRRWSERRVKAIEPLFVACCGLAVQPIDLPLGTYLLLAGVAMRLTHALAERYQRMRMLDMRDAYIEQANMAERLRHGDWNE